MKRIVLHWTAGGPVPTSYEKECYHYLVDSLGKIHLGKFKPEANLVCRTGMYAAHTGGGNTASIGVSMCAMANFRNKNDQGHFPITKVQFEAAMKLCAQLALKYNIQITPDTVMTHYEFGQKNPNTTSYGKIDIIFLPPFPWISKEDVGSFIRSKNQMVRGFWQEHRMSEANPARPSEKSCGVYVFEKQIQKRNGRLRTANNPRQLKL